MAQKRKAKVTAKAKRKATPAKAKPRAVQAVELPPHPIETAQEALVRIVQDAVVILRRELEYRAALSTARPGRVSMFDCIALLRLTADLGAAAMRSEDGQAQRADYTRLSPEERTQFAALMLKVDYA
jgi:hypothetical protein